MERTFKRIKQVHLTEYLPETINAFGYAILHGDGNIYIDNPKEEAKYQRSYLAKTFAACGNEAATYVIRFNSINQIPETLDELEKMFLDAKAKEEFESGKIELTDNFISIPKKKVEVNETENKTPVSKIKKVKD